MAPLPDDWKIIGMDEDVTFNPNQEHLKERYRKEHVEHQPENHGTGWDNPEFRKRVISAVILAPLVLGAVAWGGIAFYAMILVAAVLMMREWDHINEHRRSMVWGWAGVLYVAATALSFIVLREEQLGGSLSLIIYLLAVVWATDIGAYFAGRQVGGPKLAPAISPNKTWAGLIGGMISAVAVGGLLSIFFTFPHSLTQAAWVSSLLAVVAQIGDLFESWMKRKAGLKDSGHLIPGHGGILDRVDGLTFTAPLLVMLHYFILRAATEVVVLDPVTSGAL